MFKELYATYRPLNLKTMDLNDIKLNGGYDVNFFNDGQFADFAAANITKVVSPIPNDRYTGTLPVIGEDEQPTGETVPKLTRFVKLRYSDVYTTAEDLTASIEKCGSITGVQVFATAAEAKTWVTENTDLVEDANGFLIQASYTDELGGVVPDNYLVIN